MPTPDIKPAVAYVRMSTEHQKYSIENQIAVISAYAIDRGYEIAAVYSDAGRSGLTLSGRPELQRLLADVLRADRGFDAILVLDVSRWGRFQDTDQAAHYEFICREAGVNVQYCGEPFENDGGMVSTIVKHLKRVMAAEYSRELSAKVTRAKLQQARLGFRQGGGESYGLRRLLVATDGTPRHILRPGEHKNIRSDRILTVPGPDEEIAVVRRIFRLYATNRISFRALAGKLNAERIPTGTGDPWCEKRIANMIRNEIWIGIYVYNRKTRPLKGVARTTRPDERVRVRIGRPIISERLFREANRLSREGRYARHSDEELLRRLRKLLEREGHLTTGMIENAREMPSITTYIDHFGSVTNAYALIGYRQPQANWIDRVGGYWTRERIIEGVQRLHAANGYVTNRMIADDPELPSPNTVLRRFGRLLTCYAEAGLPADHGEINRASHERRPYKTRSKPLSGAELKSAPGRSESSSAEPSICDRPTDLGPDPTQGSA